MAEGNGGSNDERSRVDRELIELLQELRVALPGVQVLFAFLLTVPFAQGFATTTTFQRDLFFATLAATAISTALLIAPSAWHRIHFRQKNKEDMLFASNKLTLGGLAFLALAMIGAVMLIADYAFSNTLAVISGIVAAVLLAAFWAAIPLLRRPGREPT
jgi:drug/metabolite transporter (DMT)-like permease